MNNTIQPFTYKNHAVRVITIDGEPWFVLADLCKVLELSAPHMVAKRIPEDARNQTSVVDSMGRTQQATIISEAGMYEVIIRSDKPEAAAFRRWITSEVLPSIRKHGGYLTDEKIEDILTDPDTIIQLATQLKAERSQRLALEERQRLLTPQAHAFDLWLSTNADYSVAQIAKALHKAGATRLTVDGRDRSMGRNNLMSWLRHNGWVTKMSNEPLQRRVVVGYMTANYGGYINPKTGEQVGTCTPRITAKGATKLATVFDVLPDDVRENLDEPISTNEDAADLER